jgi:Tol biopolymer transport system component
MDADGSNQVNLTNRVFSAVWPTWSPDGLKIAFTSNEDDANRAEIFVMNSDGSNQLNITNNSAHDQSPSWSPDGERIAFYRSITAEHNHDEIYVMNPDGGEVQRITFTNGNNYGPFWSPNGDRLIYRSDRDGNSQIYSIGLDGTNESNLSDGTASDRPMQWSR